jgi:hypothetical protein
LDGLAHVVTVQIKRGLFQKIQRCSSDCNSSHHMFACLGDLEVYICAKQSGGSLCCRAWQPWFYDSEREDEKRLVESLVTLVESSAAAQAGN